MQIQDHPNLIVIIKAPVKVKNQTYVVQLIIYISNRAIHEYAMLGHQHQLHVL